MQKISRDVFLAIWEFPHSCSPTITSIKPDCCFFNCLALWGVLVYFKIKTGDSSTYLSLEKCPSSLQSINSALVQIVHYLDAGNKMLPKLIVGWKWGYFYCCCWQLLMEIFSVPGTMITISTGIPVGRYTEGCILISWSVLIRYIPEPDHVKYRLLIPLILYQIEVITLAGGLLSPQHSFCVSLF